MPTLPQLIAAAAGLAWFVVIVAAIKVLLTARSGPQEAPPPGNSDWYLLMQGALLVAFLLMLTQGLLAWVNHGGLSTVEVVSVACFALGFAVMSVGFTITLVRWRRAKRAN